jgi:DNA-directed RNA polymerase specialized sigma24 family protein
VRDDEAPDPFAALPQIIERLRPALARLLRRQRIPAWDAEDLVQKALAAAVRRWPIISDKQGWLYGTVRRLCIVYWRERQKDRQVATDPRLLDLREGVVIARQDRRDLLVDLDVLCAELPSRQRWVVSLRYGLGMGFAGGRRRAGDLREHRVAGRAAGLGALAEAGRWGGPTDPRRATKMWRLSREPITLSELLKGVRKELRREGKCNHLAERVGFCGQQAVQVRGDEARCPDHAEPS